MILTSKQLEELENNHDATGALSDADEEAGKEEGTEAALDWRLQLIEEAAEAIKHAKARPLDHSLTYEASSLLFDRETRRFGRVMVSVPGYLRIEYLNGGDREWGLLDVEAFLKEFGSQRPVSDLANQLGFADEDVLAELDRLGITPVEEPAKEEEAAPAAAAVAAALPPPAVGEVAAVGGDDEVSASSDDDEDDDDEAEASGDDDDDAPRLELSDDDAPPAGKRPAPKKAATAGKPALAKGDVAKAAVAKAPVAKTAVAKTAVAKTADAKGTPKKAAPTDEAVPTPMVAKGDAAEKPKSPARTAQNGEDANAFIKKNFKKMSNRELSAATGLSEHTIRRKLGEWGLKRKK